MVTPGRWRSCYVTGWSWSAGRWLISVEKESWPLGYLLRPKWSFSSAQTTQWLTLSEGRAYLPQSVETCDLTESNCSIWLIFDRQSVQPLHLASRCAHVGVRQGMSHCDVPSQGLSTLPMYQCQPVGSLSILSRQHIVIIVCLYNYLYVQKSCDSTLQSVGLDVLFLVVEFNPSMVRDFILSEAHQTQQHADVCYVLHFSFSHFDCKKVKLLKFTWQWRHVYITC